MEGVPERATGNACVRADVDTALMKLNEHDREVFHFYYMEEMSLCDVAGRRGALDGAVKSRLFGARERFGSECRRWEDINMKKMSDLMSGYENEWLDERPFEVDCEETMGWLAVPRLGEKLNCGIYD